MELPLENLNDSRDKDLYISINSTFKVTRDNSFDVCFKMIAPYSALAFKLAWSRRQYSMVEGSACNACNASWAVLVKSTKSNVECDGTNHRPRARWLAEMVVVHLTLLLTVATCCNIHCRHSDTILRTWRERKSNVSNQAIWERSLFISSVRSSNDLCIHLAFCPFIATYAYFLWFQGVGPNDYRLHGGGVYRDHQKLLRNIWMTPNGY